MRTPAKLAIAAFVLLALYVGSFHLLVWWVGSTSTYVQGPPERPMTITIRRPVPETYSVWWERVLAIYAPLRTGEARFTDHPLAEDDPRTALRRDLLRLYDLADGPAAVAGLTVAQVHALDGPARRPPALDTSLTFDGTEWRMTITTADSLVWLRHDGTRARWDEIPLHDGSRVTELRILRHR